MNLLHTKQVTSNFLPPAEINDYNVMIDERNFFTRLKKIMQEYMITFNEL